MDIYSRTLDSLDVVDGKRPERPLCVEAPCKDVVDGRSLAIKMIIKMCPVGEHERYVKRYSFHSLPESNTMRWYSSSNELP